MENIILEINDLAESNISKDFISEIVGKSISRTEISELKDRLFSLSLALIPLQEMRKHNFTYRKIDKETDVLSFAEFENIEDIIVKRERDVFLGEILLSPEYIEVSAKENEVSYEYELAYIISHGFFHLIGMNHGEKMFSLQEEVAKEVIYKS